MSSPSPVRPPQQKVRLDEEGHADQDLQQGTEAQISDPGGFEEKGSQHLSDSGDWGDTSFEDNGVPLAGKEGESKQVSNEEPNEAAVDVISSVVEVLIEGQDISSLDPVDTEDQ